MVRTEQDAGDGDRRGNDDGEHPQFRRRKKEDAGKAESGGRVTRGEAVEVGLADQPLVTMLGTIPSLLRFGPWTCPSSGEP